MIQIKELLDKHILKEESFNYYFTLIEIIEDKATKEPDICIEACKSLIEGISKTIILKLDQTSSQKDVDGMDFMPLYNNMIQLISTYDECIEYEFLERFGQTLYKVGEIRNRRGDISHGKSIPKTNTSSDSLAKMIKGFTGNLLSYVLTHFYSIIEMFPIKHEYNAPLYEKYNLYLDSLYPDFPIQTAKYSFLLFDNDYDKYIEDFESFRLDLSFEEDLIMPIDENPSRISTDVSILEAPHKVEEYKINYEFWIAEKTAILNEFCEENGLAFDVILILIDKYLFFSSNSNIQRNQILNALLEKPDLKKRKVIGIELSSKVISLIKELQKI